MLIEDIDNLLTRQVTRQEFLAYLGGALLVILGVDRFLHYLSHSPRSAKPLGSPRSSYGGSPYGGK